MFDSLVDRLPKPLLDDIVYKRCIPIIGAGFSRNAELPQNKIMPLWDDLGKYFAQQIPDFQYTTPIDAISAYEYEFGRSKLIEEMWIALHIRDAKPGSTHISFAQLPFDKILTTNIDFLLERSYEAINRNYRVITSEKQFSLNLPETEIEILKFHGDIKNPDSLIITERDYDTFLKKSPLFSTCVSYFITTRTPLLIGYSLSDPDFRQLWEILKERLGDSRRKAYTILSNPSRYDIARYERRGVKVIEI